MQPGEKKGGKFHKATSSIQPKPHLHGVQDSSAWQIGHFAWNWGWKKVEKPIYLCIKKWSKFLPFLRFNLMTFDVYFKFTGTSSTIGPPKKNSHLQVLHNLLLSPRPLPVRQDVVFVHFNDFQVQNISQYLAYCIWKPQIITIFLLR